jgi:hypothetical protein
MLKSYAENVPPLKEEEPQVSSPISVLVTETLDFNGPRPRQANLMKRRKSKSKGSKSEILGKK